MPKKWTCGHDSNVTVCPECGECCAERCVCDCEKIRASTVTVTANEIKDLARGIAVYVKDSHNKIVKILKM